VMAHSVEDLLLLLAAAGWPEKAVRLVLADLRELPQDQIERESRSLRRKLAATRKGKKPDRSDTVVKQSAAKATRLLKSRTSLSHPELAERFLEYLRPRYPNRRIAPLQAKAGLETWMQQIARELGPADLLDEVTAFRNRSAHGQEEFWRLKQ
jgi:hypothetical protein